MWRFGCLSEFLATESQTKEEVRSFTRGLSDRNARNRGSSVVYKSSKRLNRMQQWRFGRLQEFLATESLEKEEVRSLTRVLSDRTARNRGNSAKTYDNAFP